MDNPFNWLFPQGHPMHDFDPFSEENNGLAKWIGDASGYWASPRGQYEFKRTLYDIPVIGPLITHDEKMREMDRTLELYGLGYEDIAYLYRTSAGSYGSTFNYISSNVSRLYR